MYSTFLNIVVDGKCASCIVRARVAVQTPHQGRTLEFRYLLLLCSLEILLQSLKNVLLNGSLNLIIVLSNPALDLVLSQFNPVHLFASYAFNSSQLNPVKMPFIVVVVVVTSARNYPDSTSVRILELYFANVIEGRMNTVTFTNDQSCECVCRSFSLHLCFCLSYYLRNPSPHVFTKWVESRVYNIPVNS